MAGKPKLFKAPRFCWGPFTCLILAGAGGFETPAPGFGVLRYLSYDDIPCLATYLDI